MAKKTMTFVFEFESELENRIITDLIEAFAANYTYRGLRVTAVSGDDEISKLEKIEEDFNKIKYALDRIDF